MYEKKIQHDGGWPMEENWDGYGASPTTADAIAKFNELVAVPSNDGGIIIESDGKLDLIVTITPDGRITVE